MSTISSDDSYLKTLFDSFLAPPSGALLILATIVAAGWGYQAFFSAEAGAPSVAAQGTRVLVVGTDETPSTGDELHGTLVSGVLSSGVHEAEVLSDLDCEPDARGISHCLNELDFGEKHITIRHHHRMNEVPCLSPGETVTVVDEQTYRERVGS